MVAGFAFAQLTMGIPAGDKAPSFELEFAYMTLTSATIGLQLMCIFGATFLSVWGPGLALRGGSGTADLHKAVL